MSSKYLVLIGAAFAVLLMPLPCLAEELSPAWMPEPEDRFIVDLASNTGYLVHRSGERLAFPVATGQKKYVRYIGRYYKAETPARTWTAEEQMIKGDRRTFGLSGRFIRLFRNGESSPYGIHSYYKVADWMEEDKRYFSMGCIVVTEAMMDILQQTFEKTGRRLTVITTWTIAEVLSPEIAQREITSGS